MKTLFNENLQFSFKIVHFASSFGLRITESGGYHYQKQNTNHYQETEDLSAANARRFIKGWDNPCKFSS